MFKRAYQTNGEMTMLNLTEYGYVGPINQNFITDGQKDILLTIGFVEDVCYGQTN